MPNIKYYMMQYKRIILSKIRQVKKEDINTDDNLNCYPQFEIILPKNDGICGIVTTFNANIIAFP